jgi:hypothetical protein
MLWTAVPRRGDGLIWASDGAGEKISFRGKRVSELRCDFAKRLLAYLSTFDVPAFTGGSPFGRYQIRDDHQFHGLVRESLFHHSEVVEQLINCAPVAVCLVSR